ncbi:hypothetical protein SCHPADRAFT_887796 [Schizopora paradoxa]|uniref:Uncharacterized protein n=1 Tax=Schizopora paradoxa TaxID=27342 RepID=A0A0H2SHC3_9AGAM|nr:hypothetical protein SCHPADRAFT_887796 [Schizopora paradoxa]
MSSEKARSQLDERDERNVIRRRCGASRSEKCRKFAGTRTLEEHKFNEACLCVFIGCSSPYRRIYCQVTPASEGADRSLLSDLDATVLELYGALHVKRHFRWRQIFDFDMLRRSSEPIKHLPAINPRSRPRASEKLIWKWEVSSDIHSFSSSRRLAEVVASTHLHEDVPSRTRTTQSGPRSDISTSPEMAKLENISMVIAEMRKIFDEGYSTRFAFYDERRRRPDLRRMCKPQTLGT